MTADTAVKKSTTQIDFPLATITDVMAHMNSDHADSLQNMARAFAGIDWAHSCQMTRLDAHGFDLHCRAGVRAETVFVAFEPALRHAGQLRGALVSLSKRARAILAD